jgi:septum formation protein
MQRPRLVLASTSPFRGELLRRLRIPFESAPPSFEEIVAPPEPVTPARVRALVLENARGKALSVRDAFPDSLLLGSDQLAECEGRVLAKPGTEERAFEQLRFLAGKEHRLHTAVALYDPAGDRLDAEAVTSSLRIRNLGDETLRRYLRLEQPLSSAGSYISEGLGIALFDYMRGDDPTAIVGLPLILTVRLLERAGLAIPAEEG